MPPQLRQGGMFCFPYMSSLARPPFIRLTLDALPAPGRSAPVAPPGRPSIASMPAAGEAASLERRGSIDSHGGGGGRDSGGGGGGRKEKKSKHHKDKDKSKKKVLIARCRLLKLCVCFVVSKVYMSKVD